MGHEEDGLNALSTYQSLLDASRATERRVRDVHALNTGAMVELIEGDADGVIRSLEDSIDRYPDVGSLYITLSLAFGQADRHEESVTTLLEMLDRNLEPSVVVHRRLAIEYRALGRFDESRRHERIAQELGQAGDREAP